MKRVFGGGLAVVAAAGCLIPYALGVDRSEASAAAPVQIASSSTPDRSEEACAGLSALLMPDVRISQAVVVPAATRVPSSELTSMYGKASVVGSGLPAFCRVVGHIAPESGSDVGFEIWLPLSEWDGRLHGIGIGGFAGGIDYLSLGAAVKAGQVGLATDTGHSGTMMESAWAKGHPERVRDYGWRAIHVSTLAAKKIVTAFYGKGPDKSYFVGCSGGGRQGLMEAARYPEDYDGVVAGAPAANWTDLAIAMTNAVQAQRPPVGAPIRWDQTHLLQEEVVRQCDAKDGQIDGLIDDPRQCRFDATKLACDTSSSPQCFSPPQVAALERIQRGARDGRGRKLTGGYLASGSEAGNPAPFLGWEGYLLPPPGKQSNGDSHASGLLQDLAQTPIATTATFDFDKDPVRLKAALSRDLDAPTNLGRFFARGGKLILWHGWADPAIPPEATLRYQDAVMRQSGSRASTAVRLFMVPGVQHCSGGIGADVFGQTNIPKPGTAPDRDMVAALQAWVEGKRPAPESFVARRGHNDLTGTPQQASERQRLLCAWPKKAVLRAGGNADAAASYVCTRPS